MEHTVNDSNDSQVNAFQKLLDFLEELEKRHVYFTLTQVRSDTIIVQVFVPGEYWEVEFFADGGVEVEVFRSFRGVEGEEALQRLFAEHSE